MILASHQPDFFPYMGYFYKMFQSDIFVFSDDVQYSKKGRHNYNDILTANGPKRFTLPISYHVVNLDEIQIAATENDITRMLKTLWMEYKKAEHFSEAFTVFEELLFFAISDECKSLADFNYHCLVRLADEFGLAHGRRFYRSSDLELHGHKDERIIDMCKLFEADTYYSGTGAKDYHSEQEFENNGITLKYSDYTPVEYQQVEKRQALNMSVIDYVMNCGFNLPEGWKKDE